MDKDGKLTPMMEQYYSILRQCTDSILFYRVGDFYEMFGEQAEEVSAVLGIVLTKRSGVALCGVPYHAYKTYAKRLMDCGYKVAICEQKSEAVPGKLVERDIVHTYTPGTLVDEDMLSDFGNNYIGSFYRRDGECGMAFADLSTGELNITKSADGGLLRFISEYRPNEILFNADFVELTELSKTVHKMLPNCLGKLLEENEFEVSDGVFSEHFGEDIPDSLRNGTDDNHLPARAAAALLRYIKSMSRCDAKRFVSVNVFRTDEYLEIGPAARFNLELLETARTRERRGSLLWALDKTKTAAGKRFLIKCINRPLMNQVEITLRLQAVKELVGNNDILTRLRESFAGITDCERLLTRVVYDKATPRDVKSLGECLLKLPAVKAIAEELRTDRFQRVCKVLQPLDELSAYIQNAVADEPPLLRDGGVIKDGFDAELDKYRKIRNNADEILRQIEQRERERTGIKSLRISSNRVFGYYIEISKAQARNAPADYVRRQTIATGERFVTEELKSVEDDIVNADKNAQERENAIFSDILERVREKTDVIQLNAEQLAFLDVIASFAYAAVEQNYTMPVITLDDVIEIRGGRHPVVEKMTDGGAFTPNDCLLDGKSNRTLVITGPNMGGKSTYMRQVALIVIMAQMGSFVPADYVRLGVVDKVFTRIGAGDDLTAGQSTFMTEMLEVSEILHNATPRSLVILDELGRGTSTFDGISLAWSVAEYVNGTHIRAKTLLSTHFHELIKLEKEVEGVRNFNVKSVRRGGEIVFLHKIEPGGAKDSFGIEVAKLARLPSAVINRARKILHTLEYKSKTENAAETAEDNPQLDLVRLAGIDDNDNVIGDGQDDKFL